MFRATRARLSAESVLPAAATHTAPSPTTSSCSQSSPPPAVQQPLTNPLGSEPVGFAYGVAALLAACGDDLFQRPRALLPGYADRQGPAAGDFPTAEHVHAATVKLPVRHRDQDIPLADDCTAAIAEVASHAKDLL
ncbi:hypothetical protein [Streptomyces sp. ISL-11]|uniref:hypothetical protein n=1 Tax=Streptomyces sp. ISL-11 TaxID=2819174 RepID=UPI001BEAB034|nr:hypothetical protein [Streptomyces sp. ISL-11]MBT2386582.1 hypothetical protein [Streptomyces sp. ISL-11]